MPVGPIESFVIDDKSIADTYLRDLLAKPEYRTMGEVRMRADKHIRDANIKTYFISEAEKALAR